MERVQKIIANSGLMSRRKAEDLIKEGKVLVNGKPAVIGDKAEADSDKIAVNGKTLVPERKIYLIFNKPKYVICSMERLAEGKSIFDYVKIKERLYPAGRLDFDSEGLVFLTNDGKMTDLLTHPRYETEKEYIVELDKSVSDDDLDRLRKGIMLEDGMSWPAEVEILDNRMRLDIIIHEGRKAQIKRMFIALGLKVTMLKRIRMGNILMEHLLPGKHRELSYNELSGLKKTLDKNYKKSIKTREERLSKQKEIRPNPVKYVRKDIIGIRKIEPWGPPPEKPKFGNNFERFQAEKRKGRKSRD
jgi:23S rRNA pseudouridine2605 synthase